MTTAELTAIISVCGTVITAVMGVVVQWRVASVNARSARRIAEIEQYQPRLYDALECFSSAYSRLYRHDTAGYVVEQKPAMDSRISAYRDFLAAGYRVMALVPDADLHSDLSALMDKIGENGFTVYPQTDNAYRSIAERLARHITLQK